MGTVEGIIEGLQEGQTVAPATIKLTSSPFSVPEGGFPFSISRDSGSGFMVLNNSIVSADWRGHIDINEFRNALNFFPGPDCGLPESVLCGALSESIGGAGREPVTGPVQFSLRPAESSAAVPGPLSVLGAAAAFGYSRKLRKRINGSNNTVSTAPFT